MTRSAVRSRLAPPASACFASYGSASLPVPYRSEASEGCRGAARRAKPGLGNPNTLPSLPRKPRRSLLHKTRHALPKIAPFQRDLHFAVGIDSGFRQRLERHVVELALDHRNRTRRDEIGQIARIGIGLLAQQVRRIEAIDQPDPQRLLA